MAQEQITKQKSRRVFREKCQETEFPNTWGHQEFAGEYRHYGWDKQIDVNNKLRKHSFIQDFQIRHIDGISLSKPRISKRCRDCNC